MTFSLLAQLPTVVDTAATVSQHLHAAASGGLATVGGAHTLLPDWMDAQHLIDSFGDYALIGVVIVIFIETGLLFPFLPGDSLLFTAGMLVAQGDLKTPLWLLCLMLFVAAFAGDQTAYQIGHTAGPRLLRRPDTRFFKRKHIAQTQEYFDRYGGRTIVVARFVPFVRTYASVVAGVAGMRRRTFIAYDLVGAFLWAVGVTMLGFALGNITFVKDNIELLLVAIVLVSVVPVGLELLKARRNGAASQQTPATIPVDGVVEGITPEEPSTL